ncbi:MAG: PAS domain-containing sensor histidine kinase [Planctomycetes bacterium]|jgi:signal transduction histidine kinase|nr:PAS domain-containing sensor histidine kinase [Planctomycetota bacterium]
MRTDLDNEFEPEALPRFGLDGRIGLLRMLAMAAGLVACALGFDAPWSAAVLVGSGSMLAVVIERLAVRREAAARMRVLARAARTEGQRDAIAQVMSLELAYDRSRSVFDSLREGVLVVDGSGEIVLANPAARRAMRSPAIDPSGSLLWDALTPELARLSREAWQALHESSHALSELPQIRYSAIPCRDAVYDLTAVQAKSSRTGQDFGSVFLLVDSTRAHELQRLKDRFLSSVSHELRTPLTNICAYSEILRHMLPGDSEEWPEFVRVIHEEGLQLNRLVDEMFDYLQLESGEARFANDLVDGTAVVRETIAAFELAAKNRELSLELVVTNEPPQLVGDRKRLQQVVRSLIDNAVKFTPAGGQVRVGVAAREEAFELRIEDTGPGVPPTERLAVFEKFNQLPDLMTSKPAGTGLGLATSRAITARLGGLIWCEDSPLGGAAFVVLLPSLGQPRMATIGGGGGF